MKTTIASIFVAVLSLGLSSVASACDWGNLCDNPVQLTPTIGVVGQFTGNANAGGWNAGTANASGPYEFNSYSVGESSTLADGIVTLTDDAQPDCTDCGDNLVKMTVGATDFQAVGVQAIMNSTPVNAPQYTGASTAAQSNVSGTGAAVGFRSK